MLEIALIREKPEWVKDQLRNLNDEGAIDRIDAILDLDGRRRALLTEVEAIKANRNKLNKQMGKFRGNKKLSPAEVIGGAQAAVRALADGDIDGFLAALAEPPTADNVEPSEEAVKAALDELTDNLKNLGARVSELDEEIRQIEADLNEHMVWIPNMPHNSTPVALHEEDNVIHDVQGDLRTFEFDALPHWDLGPMLDLIDFERGVKTSGTRFYVLKGEGARLYRAMIYWLLELHTTEHGYTEIYPPFMVREDALYGAAQFPKFRDVVYFDAESELYMLPTAEVALTNMHADEIFEEADLPLHYVAHTPCFRREKFSAGRDVRGIKRVHQFEKVEMYKFTTPETSYDELESLVQNAEHVCHLLDIPYRRVEIVTGDLGFAAAKKYDVEMWAPGCGEWLEVSSCSNTEAFQARRANVRYRPADGGRTQFVHTLNGSGLGMVRALIAVMENYQQADGSIVIPDVLRPFLGGQEVIEPKD
ncbi:MAG: serine--tRNA ligase [Chloroflexi bacterium]|nr:serine--tRNA ligase [Chloroflexota bacterium]